MSTITQVVIGVAIIAAFVAFAITLALIVNRGHAERAKNYHDLHL